MTKLKQLNERPNRIAELRRKRGISQEKLAEELNVTQASISLYENGSNIPTDILIRTAQYFDVTVDYLLMASNLGREETAAGLSAEEHGVLKFYRNLPIKYRRLINELICIVSA